MVSNLITEEQSESMIGEPDQELLKVSRHAVKIKIFQLLKDVIYT